MHKKNYREAPARKNDCQNTVHCDKKAKFQVYDLYVQKNYKLCGKCLDLLYKARQHLIKNSDEKLTWDDVKFEWKRLEKKDGGKSTKS